MKNPVPTKKEILGQYFTKPDAVETALRRLFSFKEYNKTINILEPSFGTGNFISALKQAGFSNIEGCEIDASLTTAPSDFFQLSLDKKYDLIVGNPPFTKYNIRESYFFPKNIISKVLPNHYIPDKLVKKEKLQIENVFILKAIQHLRDNNSSIGFVLPISFFIKKKNSELKKVIAERFSTVIIYQNDLKWFDEPIPCCFAIFTNTTKYRGKLVLLYDDGQHVEEILDLDRICDEELIPKSYLYKKEVKMHGLPLSKFIKKKPSRYVKSFQNQNVTAANILERTKIGEGDVEDYQLAIVRVGNGSVGKAGLVNIKKDILNDMFYVFQFNDEYNYDAKTKEQICRLINENHDYFRNVTFRVGSKSIKKTDVLEFNVDI